MTRPTTRGAYRLLAHGPSGPLTRRRRPRSFRVQGSGSRHLCRRRIVGQTSRDTRDNVGRTVPAFALSSSPSTSTTPGSGSWPTPLPGRLKTRPVLVERVLDDLLGVASPVKRGQVGSCNRETYCWFFATFRDAAIYLIAGVTQLDFVRVSE